MITRASSLRGTHLNFLIVRGGGAWNRYRWSVHDVIPDAQAVEISTNRAGVRLLRRCA